MNFKYSGIWDETTLQITASWGFDSEPSRYNRYAILLYQEIYLISRMKRIDFESVTSRRWYYTSFETKLFKNSLCSPPQEKLGSQENCVLVVIILLIAYVNDPSVNHFSFAVSDVTSENSKRSFFPVFTEVKRKRKRLELFRLDQGILLLTKLLNFKVFKMTIRFWNVSTRSPLRDGY